MNNLTRVILAAFALLPAVAAAQGQPYPGEAALTRLTSEHLWLSTPNAAALSSNPVGDFNILDVRGRYSGGDFRRAQTGRHISGADFSTEGAKRVGKVSLDGEFIYSNTSDRGAAFNTLLYDPYDERFLYTAADTTASTWKRQSYTMGVRAGMPVVTDHLWAGLAVSYADKIAAKQQDPRAESYHYTVKVVPSAVVSTGIGRFGANVSLSRTFERSTPSLSNSQVIQRVFMLRGLGNYVEDYVGASSLSTMYFRSKAHGAGIQYWGAVGRTELLADLQWERHSTTIKENATSPRSHGTTSVNDLSLSVSAVSRGTLVSIAALDLSGRMTSGTEHTTIWDTEANGYVTRSKIRQYSSARYEGSMSYTLRKPQGSSYIWDVAGSVKIDGEDDSYHLPKSNLSWWNALASVEGTCNLALPHSSVLLHLGFRHNFNLDGDYSYSGVRTGSPVVEGLYRHDLGIMSSDWTGADFKAAWERPVRSGMTVSLYACAAYVTAGSRDRLATAGGVALYF